MLRFLPIIFVLLFTTACSNFEYSTNLDKENFDEYFKPSEVTVYQKSDLEDLEYDVIGAVDGSSCQQKENEVPANERDARTKGRINAADMGANGVIFQTCLKIEPDKTCITNTICYGRALNVTIDE